MPKKKRLTPLESIVMDSVWKMPEATVKQVQENLKKVKPMAYNTVLTMMRILRDKGFLKSERNGRMDVYRATVSREEIGRGSLRDILEKFYSGSAASLVSHLLDSQSLTSAEIKEIRKQVNAKLDGKPAKKESKL